MKSVTRMLTIGQKQVPIDDHAGRFSVTVHDHVTNTLETGVLEFTYLFDAEVEARVRTALLEARYGYAASYDAVVYDEDTGRQVWKLKIRPARLAAAVS